MTALTGQTAIGGPKRGASAFGLTHKLAFANFRAMSFNPPFILDSDAPGKALMLREALRLFAHKGMSATSIRDIAKATGLSNPALYKHFKTKDELALVLFERLYRNHVLSLRNDVGKESGFRAKLRALLKNRLRVYDEHPDATIFATDNLMALWPNMPKEMKDQTILSLLREIIELGRSEGTVESDAEITMQMAVVTGILEQVTRQKFFGNLPGTALSHLNEVERILGKALG
ncbi:TetR/AcrR family transcriptional regulator [Aliiroseovarius sp. Z3]|uniref:TetR/AcrR family transcriptional regulator n=1 Tax=Aliiroseovarius sp. Z3 TaxID=2811402 RepID=UPI0023B34E97|nr:TetR/AcrR family transcriptional regulator [Aliiroseovarius sp. Z3]MDE9449789.1 TetR/AcrR family transcriptional regulator [Aliiroseovarius sp. Z3]